MKRHLKEPIMENRERKIIQYIQDNPFCSKDSIFTKNKIPKSRVTNELIEKLIDEKKIKTTSMKRKRFYVKEINFLTRLEILVKDYAYENKFNPENYLDKIVVDFLKNRIKVLRAEQKIVPNVDLRETLRILKFILVHYKKPNVNNATIVFSLVINASVNDRYYLTHQLKSQPKNTQQIFQKIKIRNSRRSLPELVEMKEKGKNEFGLTKKDFEKNMEKLTNKPWEWLRRFNAETGRTLYPKTLAYQSELIEKMIKELGKKKKKKEPKSIKKSNQETEPVEKLNKNAMKELNQIMKIKNKN